MNTDDLAADLLLRSHVEITLLVDSDTANDLPDDILDCVLGAEARRLVRDALED
jgi:hypothetical protein